MTLNFDCLPPISRLVDKKFCAARVPKSWINVGFICSSNYVLEQLRFIFVSIPILSSLGLLHNLLCCTIEELLINVTKIEESKEFIQLSTSSSCFLVV